MFNDNEDIEFLDSFRLNERSLVIRSSKQKLYLASILCVSSSMIYGASYNYVSSTVNGFKRSDDDSINGFIGGFSNQASESVGNVPGNRYWGDFLFDYHRQKPEGLEVAFTLSALRNDQSLLMYSLQEAYVGGDLTAKDNLKVGRIVIPWSTIDSTWGFGKVNNRQNFTGFDPGQEGLTGISYERKSSNGMRYRFFGSALYVPELNPSLDVNKDDKTITTRNPWADPPSPTTEVTTAGVTSTKRIEYNVNYPSISQVVNRYTIGANIGWENKNWAAEGFYLYKPENQLSTNVEVKYNTGTDYIKAYVTPQIYYHHVFGGNLKYHNKDVEMYVSGMGIQPNTFPDGNADYTRDTNIKTEKVREAYMGGGINRINDIYGMGFNYIARLSPFDRVRDALVVDPRWNQAVNAFLLRNFGRHYTLSADLKYDMLTTDRLMMLKASYKPTNELMLSLGVNMIGTPANGESYWSPYTNNDSVYGSLRYIF